MVFVPNKIGTPTNWEEVECLERGVQPTSRGAKQICFTFIYFVVKIILYTQAVLITLTKENLGIIPAKDHNG